MRRLSSCLLHILIASATSGAADAFDDRVEQLARTDRIERTSLCETPGGRPLHLLSVRPRTAGDGRAVLVVANPLGATPFAAEAALELARRVAEAENGPSWYIVPTLCVDASARRDPLSADGANAHPVDDDVDGAVDEDGPDDLDGDGRIATLLLDDPEGAWLIDPATALTRKADPARGERGRYLRLTEGRDDDGDGAWNEDGPGGAVPGRNFPHGFVHWTPSNGPWPASEPESRALLRFAFDHPEIALVLVLGETNTLRTVPASVDAPDPLLRSHSPPRWFAREAGLDPLREYPLADLTEAARAALEDPNLSELDVLGFLDLGPAAAPPAADLLWWNALAAAWTDSLAAAGLDAPRAASAPAVPGNVQDWAFYQFGVPALALDFWTAPLPAPADSTAPPPDDPDGLALQAVPGAWIPWTDVTLPDGRTGRTGGFAPFAAATPPADRIDALLDGQLPFLLTLPAWLPRLESVELAAEHRGGEVWRVEAHVRNGGRIPYPTAQGRRCRRPAPVALTLAGAEVLEGRARQVIDAVPAGGAATTAWLVRAKPGDAVTVKAAAPGFGAAEARLVLHAKGGRR
jgi:hypothetical protein